MEAMRSWVDTRDPAAVEMEVQMVYVAMFPDADRFLVPRTFGWAIECFSGAYADYQAVDARYHDFEHTLQGVLCLARLLLGRHRAQVSPVLTQRTFELGLLAMLLHDTGYLKKRYDREGTGAKYTLVHVDRSAAFARQLLAEKRFPPESITAVQNMIHCTGVNVNLPAIPFADDLERLVALALGTADLLGQMAAPDYVDKLPILYGEFMESARFYADQRSMAGQFDSAEDLMGKTPVFWEKTVLPRMEGDFGGMYRYLNDPYPDGPNSYLECIQANLERIKRAVQTPFSPRN